jgi:undecaprenyl-phosphate 4-deoxy-4-formamido-L-arabinose transferase
MNNAVESAGPRVAVSVVVPVYGSAKTLRPLFDRLCGVLEGTDEAFEVIFVDDGSPDESWEVLVELHGADPRVKAVQLMRNYGQHNALMAGFRHAQGRIVVTLDDDLQHPPEEIPKLLDALRATELDLVYGTFGDKQHGAWRNLGSAVVGIFYRAVFRSSVQITSFRAIRRELLETIFPYNLNFTFIDGLLAWNTRRIGATRVAHHPRALGRSGYTLARLLVLTLNFVTNFSLLPLQLVSACGFLTAGLGLLTAFYYLFQYFSNNIVVPGYASVIIAILVLGGVQLLALGIIGEYLGRLHMNVNRKPQYFERQVLGRGARSDKRHSLRSADTPGARTGGTQECYRAG